MKDYALGTLAGLQLSAEPSAVASSLGGWALASGAARRLGLPGGRAAGVGLAVVGLHWASELFHQLGHASAARHTGHPMTGIRAWILLSASGYPADEPALPAGIHIRRALGGPAASALLSLVTLGVARAVPRRWPLLRGLAWFTFWENLLVFTVGAFIPLGFNDGSTLLHWWHRRRRGSTGVR